MKNILSLLILLSFNFIAESKQGFTEVEFLTSDGIKISASYSLPKTQKSLLPAIILIHQGGSSRQEWFELPMTEKLVDNGYAVLAYDIRQHGASGKDHGDYNLYNDPNKAPLDLLAAIDFLKKDSQIDQKRIGIIGASIGANLACVAASSNKFNIKSVVVMSAKTEAVQNLSGSKVVLSPMNAFYIASKDEQNGMRAKWANELYNRTTEDRKVEIAQGNKHGSYILRDHPLIQKDIIEWFAKTL